jgi:hypothetical protein
MADMVTLTCPPGAHEYPISHGTTNYRAYLADPSDEASDWLVDVPPEVAIHFLHKGGFGLTQVHIFQSAGNIRMIARSGASSCSWGGQSFEPDADGAVTVPVEALADLVNHNFVPYNEALAPKHEEPAPAAAPAAPARAAKQTADGGGATKLPIDPGPEETKANRHPDAVRA